MSVLERDRIDFTMMYATHRAFRRDINRLIEAASTRAEGASKVHDGWENFKTQLSLHHSVEDADLWPRLRLVVADRSSDIALLDQMEDEHAELEPLLAAVDVALEGPPITLVGYAQDLMKTLGHHLKHEEDDGLPLMQSVLTLADWRSFAGQMRRRQGIRGAAAYVPWVLDGAPIAEQQQFLAALPAPVRLISRLFWEPRYRKRNLWNL
jgi:hypothetical protein